MSSPRVRSPGRNPHPVSRLPHIGMAFLGLLWAALPVAAQDTSEGQDTVTLSPLHVTVLRAPTRLDELPFSVSVLHRPDLSVGTTGVFLAEALRGLPGVQVQNRYNASQGERISIRGFGARAQFGVRGIKVLVDGIPATLPDGQTTLDHLDIGSLGRVEALRGPAAALYGNGAGGVLLFHSRGPSSTAHEQEATVVVGSHGLLRLQGTVLGRAGSVAYSASLAQSEYDGFRNNLTENREDPYSASSRSTLNAGLSTTIGGGELRVRLSGMKLDALNPGSLPRDLFDEGSNQAWGFNVARGTRKDLSQAQAGASWTGPLGSLRGTFSAYGVSRSMESPIPPTVIDLDRKGGGLRGTLGKAWDRSAGEAAIDIGGEIELQQDDRKNFANEGGEAGELRLDQIEDVRASALFATARMAATQRLTLTAAARFDNVRFEADDKFIGSDNPDDSGTSDMSSISPSIGVHLSLGEAGLYGSVARSFETPTTTELGNQPDRAGGLNPNLDPQVGWTTEVGLRGVWENQLAYDLALFNTKLSGQLVPFEVESAPGRTYFRNAGRSRIRGLEASTRAKLSDVVTSRVSYSYVDARFTEFESEGESFANNRVPGIAPHSLAGSLRASDGRWFGEVSLEVRGAVPADDANQAEADGFTLLDLKFGASALDFAGTSLSPFAGVQNLTDTRYASSVVVNAFGGRYFEPGPERSFFVGLSLTFGPR